MTSLQLYRRRRAVAVVGAALLGVIGVFPPWQRLDQRASGNGSVVLVSPAGYRFILSPPRFHPSRGFQIDIGRWVVQYATVVALGTGLILALGSVRGARCEMGDNRKSPVGEARPLATREDGRVSNNGRSSAYGQEAQVVADSFSGAEEQTEGR